VPYRDAPQIKRPSEQLEDLLMGRVAWDDAPASIRSWARLPIFDAAQTILAAPDKGTRRNMLGKIPAPIRPRVEAEVKRLWGLR
tara:strand:+ start:865 stop:1116 length:252 start_codon:yes stop_codon:yes gene_type:complete